MIGVPGVTIGGSGANIGDFGAKIWGSGAKILGYGAKIGGSGAKIGGSRARVARGRNFFPRGILANNSVFSRNPRGIILFWMTPYFIPLVSLVVFPIKKELVVYLFS